MSLTRQGLSRVTEQLLPKAGGGSSEGLSLRYWFPHPLLSQPSTASRTVLGKVGARCHFE